MTGWVVKPMSINDVPMVTLTLYSNQADDYELRRVADELLHRLQSIPDAGRSYVVAGRKRQVRVVADPARLAGHGLDLAALAQAIEVSNVNVPAGHFSRQNREYLVEAGPFLKSADEVANLLVGLHQGKPVYLRDVAEVVDGPEEPVAASQHRLRPGRGAPPGYERGRFYPAVTMAVAKRLGTNAVTVAQGLLDRLEELKKEVIPPYIQVKVTRNYGQTANEKVNELMRELLIAVLSITVLLTLFLGWRQALIVALAVPLTLAITLTGNMLFGYTINRVTLFALILSLGLLVDDPIIDVENIHRHFQLRQHPPLEATLVAVDEVRAPTILATFTVIISFIPMYFVTGMMGPYMRPMPLNVPLAMLMSLFIAFTVTPWATYHFLKKEYGKEEKPFVLEETWIYRTYTRILTPLLESRRKSHLFLLAVVVLLLISVALPVLGLVPLKMLPFDNKSDFLVVANQPNDAPLEATQEALQDFGRYLTTVHEVDSVVTLCRGERAHRFQRPGAPLLPHAGALRGAAPGQPGGEGAPRRGQPRHCPVGAPGTYGDRPETPDPPGHRRGAAGAAGPADPGGGGLRPAGRRLIPASFSRRIQVKEFFLKTPGVVDVDTTVETAEPRFRFLVDRDKAALSGLAAAQIARGVAMAQAGETVGRVHLDRERLPLEILLRWPAARALLDPRPGPALFQKPRRLAGAVTGVGPL